MLKFASEMSITQVILLLTIIKCFVVDVVSNPVGILINIDERNENGYHFRYVTEDGQEHEETGTITRDSPNSIPILRVEGYYANSIDGKTYKTNYKADENGYRAKTSLLSSDVSPVIPKGGLIPTVPYIGSSAIASLVGGGLG